MMNVQLMALCLLQSTELNDYSDPHYRLQTLMDNHMEKGKGL